MTLICAICGKTVELGAEPGAGKCDESKDDPSVSCLSADQEPVD